MVTVRFRSSEQLTSCANFLRFSFPGEVRTTTGGSPQLELEFTRGVFEPSVEEALVGRLLWAWSIAVGLDGEQAAIISRQHRRTAGCAGD